jgi:F0F1-type ATP synthase assembly protein I
MPEPNDPSWGKVAALGLQTAFGLLLGAVVGIWIDKKYKTDPWGILIGSGLGFLSGLYLLIREAIRVNKN